MLDSKYLRHHLDEMVERLKTRGFSFDKTHYLNLESKRKSLQENVQTLQQKANDYAKQLGQAQRSQSQHTEADKAQWIQESKAIKATLQIALADFQVVKNELDNLLLTLPNLPDESTPVGACAKENKCVRTWGQVPNFSFQPKDHVTLTTQGSKPPMDFEQAAVMTGSRFVVLQGPLARLQRALTQWMLDVHTQEHGYTEMAVPFIVNATSLQATGQLPLFEKDLFKLQSPDDWYLIPTGEVPLTNLAKNRIFEANELPEQYAAYTPCFRSEAGSYGQDVRGMIRQHQFDKVELVHLVKKEHAMESLERLTQAAETILQRLHLPYRVMALCTGDLGFASTKTYDLEVWLPGQSAYREISSCSYMGDFQGRRLKARYRCPETKQLKTVHTLNGSGLAVGRTLVAILENYQKEEGRIEIPEVLHPYMGGVSSISPLG